MTLPTIEVPSGRVEGLWMIGKIVLISFCAFVVFCSSACAATFGGRVIDADTKEPIEGAVVVAKWLEERATITGSGTRLRDVKEALTDKNGEWEIKGPKGRDMGDMLAIFTFVTGAYITNPPEFIIFKPGYCPYGSLIDVCMKKMKPIGNDRIAEGETVELPRLTKGEDRVRAIPGLVNYDNMDEIELYKKQRGFIRIINEERRNFGLEEFPIPKELEK